MPLTTYPGTLAPYYFPLQMSYRNRGWKIGIYQGKKAIPLFQDSILPDFIMKRFFLDIKNGFLCSLMIGNLRIY
jgi:hypothetical protein